jgi:hypothetical protein
MLALLLGCHGWQIGLQAGMRDGGHRALARASTRARLAACAAGALLALSASAAGAVSAGSAATPLLLDAGGVSVAAYGGWAAWSRLDMASGRYALVTRSPAGAIALAAVPESAAPFDVELGRARGSAVNAVYSRCTDTSTHRGCHMFVLELAASGAAERPLAPPGGGSNHEPAIWEGSVAFLRRNLAGGRRRPDTLLVWQIGSRTLRVLTLPSSRGNRSAGWPAGLTGQITGLSFNGQQVAYATSNLVSSFGETTLWFEPLAGHPELIDQQTSGAGNVCAPAFLSPLLSGRWLYAYLHACDPTANPRLDRLTRYRHGQVQSAAYTFIRSGDEPISSAVLDGAGVDWDAYGVERLSRVSWRTITPPVPQTFCSRGDPFC